MHVLERPTIVALLVLGALCVPAAARESPAPSESWAIDAGVVALPRQGAVAVTRPDGGIDLLDARTGAIRRQNLHLGRVLLLRAGVLLAQTTDAEPGMLRLVGLAMPAVAVDSGDPGAAPRERFRVAVPLPAGMVPDYADTAESVFRVAASWVEGRALVWWHHTALPSPRTSPGRGPPAGPTRQRGGAWIDLAEGRVQTIEEKGLDRLLQPPLPDTVRAAVAAQPFGLPPRRVADVITLPEVRPGETRSVVLRRWEATTGKVLPEVRLAADGYLPANVSGDERHLIVARTLVVEGDAWRRYHWRLHDLESGRLVGELRTFVGGAPFGIVGDTLLYVSPPYGRKVGETWIREPLTLRAVDLATGEERWTRPVRDPAFRGLAPPGGR